MIWYLSAKMLPGISSLIGIWMVSVAAGGTSSVKNIRVPHLLQKLLAEGLSNPHLGQSIDRVLLLS
jgi:hypothetical protein